MNERITIRNSEDVPPVSDGLISAHKRALEWAGNRQAVGLDAAQVTAVKQIADRSMTGAGKSSTIIIDAHLFSVLDAVSEESATFRLQQMESINVRAPDRKGTIHEMSLLDYLNGQRFDYTQNNLNPTGSMVWQLDENQRQIRPVVIGRNRGGNMAVNDQKYSTQMGPLNKIGPAPIVLVSAGVWHETLQVVHKREAVDRRHGYEIKTQTDIQWEKRYQQEQQSLRVVSSILDYIQSELRKPYQLLKSATLLAYWDESRLYSDPDQSFELLFSRLSAEQDREVLARCSALPTRAARKFVQQQCRSESVSEYFATFTTESLYQSMLAHVIDLSRENPNNNNLRSQFSDRLQREVNREKGEISFAQSDRFIPGADTSWSIRINWPPLRPLPPRR